MAGIAPRPQVLNEPVALHCLMQLKKLQQFALTNLILIGILNASNFFLTMRPYFSTHRPVSKKFELVPVLVPA